MKIKIHGEEREIAPDTSILALLKELSIEEKTMAAAVNMEVVKKEEWDRYILSEDDKVEFLHFVGGG
ncbi:MAG: thiamine biosynthesis protein ThiS [Campylobacteraceae bacterium 4484_4]|nr:MAG: thiamine biosynthesis protein ThiS [Campylobacteraceae bacterium 4484_4]